MFVLCLSFFVSSVLLMGLKQNAHSIIGNINGSLLPFVTKRQKISSILLNWFFFLIHMFRKRANPSSVPQTRFSLPGIRYGFKYFRSMVLFCSEQWFFLITKVILIEDAMTKRKQFSRAKKKKKQRTKTKRDFDKNLARSVVTFGLRKK